MSRRFFPRAEFPPVRGLTTITPQIAEWKYAGLAIVEVKAGVPVFVDERILSHSEGALIPLNTENVKVRVDGKEFTLNGRPGVFAGPSDWIYCTANAKVEIQSQSDGEIAIGTSATLSSHPTVYIDAIDTVEIRGAGEATREVRPFMHPDNFKGAGKLMAVEVITPDGNFSSYPPHRHDGMGDCNVSNEEIYYFRIGKGNSAHGDPEGFGSHRTYSGPEDPHPFDDNHSVRDGDIYLVPRGYHGPCVAMPGYPMYYLNILAGDTTPRTMEFCDNPDHAWIRESWNSQTPDPRVPWKVKP